jgi:hypothetical protein
MEKSELTNTEKARQMNSKVIFFDINGIFPKISSWQAKQ